MTIALATIGMPPLGATVLVLVAVLVLVEPLLPRDTTAHHRQAVDPADVRELVEAELEALENELDPGAQP